MAMTERMRTLRELFDRLACFYVENWGPDSSAPDSGDRPVADVMRAHVVSSLHRGVTKGHRHAVVLDIDHPAWLVASSTPGHHHLYIDVPGGIPHNKYVTLLNALADAGVIEWGYVNASKKRGHTDVRLPWVKKEGVAQPWASVPVPVPVPARAPDWASEQATEGWMD